MLKRLFTAAAVLLISTQALALVDGRVKRYATEATLIATTGATDRPMAYALDTGRLFVWDGTNSQWLPTVGGTTLVGHDDVIRFCGQGSNAATANYIGPNVPADMDTDLSYGSTGCDGKDSTTEATADLIWSPGADFDVVAMMCSIDEGITGDHVFQLRDDTTDVTGVTCTITSDATGFDKCVVRLEDPPTVAAGSTIAVEVVGDAGDNCSACDVECKVFVTY